MLSPKLGVLDFSPFLKGKLARKAITETIEIARYADQLGYHRYWLAEHHNNFDFAGTSPEILIAHIAGLTIQMRIGAGGVLLPHYSPYRVAERFLLLETLFPNRIDLGLCRSFGMKDDIAAYFFPNSNLEPTVFDNKMNELLTLLAGDFSFQNKRLNLTDISETRPEVWLLGASKNALDVAYKKGLKGAYAHFLRPQLSSEIASGMKVLEQNAMAIVVICAETEEKAEKLRKNALKMGLNRLQGNSGGIPEPQSNLSFQTTEADWLKQLQKGIISGSPKEVKNQLHALAKQYHLNEILCIPFIYELEDRKRSLKLLKEAF